MITTLCYMYRDDEVLMLYRNKKKEDVNKGKWIGVGGKAEKGESPHHAILREINEETGYLAKRCEFRGIVVFNYNDNPSEYMHLYTCKDFTGELKSCDEGELKWIKKSDVMNLNLWEGDDIFLDLLNKDCEFFYLTLNYHNDTLLSHQLEFETDYTLFEVFVPQTHVQAIVDSLKTYDLLKDGYYDDVYACLEVEGHWTPLEGAHPYDGEVGVHSTAHEILMKFRVKSEFSHLARLLIKKAHPYESPVINMLHV